MNTIAIRHDSVLSVSPCRPLFGCNRQDAVCGQGDDLRGSLSAAHPEARQRPWR
jgi:hypothetical protein